MSEPKEPKHSCPFLDEAIKVEKNITECLSIREDYELDDVLKCVSDAQWYEGDIESACERAREIHIDLRAWGQYYFDRCDELEAELSELREQGE